MTKVLQKKFRFFLNWSTPTCTLSCFYFNNLKKNFFKNDVQWIILDLNFRFICHLLSRYRSLKFGQNGFWSKSLAKLDFFLFADLDTFYILLSIAGVS